MSTTDASSSQSPPPRPSGGQPFGTTPPRIVSDRSLAALCVLNFFLADARDGLGPFLDAFLATRGWSSLSLGLIATIGGLIGLAATPLCGALVDGTPWKRALIAGPVILVTAAALITLVSPEPAIVWIGQIGTAVVGAVIGPALAGLTLGLVGERLFSQQIARNEFWNHTGNFASLFAVYVIISLFGQAGMIWLMVATAFGALAAVALIDPRRIDHKVARGLRADGNASGTGDADAPSGFDVLLKSRGLILLAVILLIFHFGNAPMSRLIAQQFAIELGTPFRTTAIITGIAQLSMVAVAVLTPFLIRRIGLGATLAIGLAALPVRGLIAGTFEGFWVVWPVQILDGAGAGLLGIVTPVAVERILKGTGRFNVGFASVMTVQGIGASLSNVVAGWLVVQGGYPLSHLVGGGVALVALAVFAIYFREIAPPQKASEVRAG
ncbi:Major Facilitator Superfamily protein [Rhizobium sp. NFR07]|uniref:MFS transporter n=1 Tax=Rhizobium sp. NFR07 TaxID=1566262 RepID=UPI0008EAE7CB|nr:MFS transporter [Rhizobium sp. NFR07]SFB40064.1 Major Facilitator Superfamily protein [Rhizobium sp. NFR07]